MSQEKPNAPEDFVWIFLDIDVPFCRDLILLQEQKQGSLLNNEAAIILIQDELCFARNRAKQIVDTIKGEVL